MKKGDKEEITRRDIAVFGGLLTLGAGLLGRIIGRKNYEAREPAVKAAAITMVVPGGLLVGMEIGESLQDPNAMNAPLSSMSRRAMVGIALFGSSGTLMSGFKSNKYLPGG